MSLSKDTSHALATTRYAAVRDEKSNEVYNLSAVRGKRLDRTLARHSVAHSKDLIHL